MSWLNFDLIVNVRFACKALRHGIEGLFFLL